MGKYFGAVVTANGQKMFAEAIAEKRVITFTAVKTSTYTIPSGTNPATLTTLPNIKQSVAPSYSQVVDENIVQVAANFSNAKVTADYNVNTLGLYAKRSGSNTEVLFAVIQADTPDVIENGQGGSSLASYVYNIQMYLSNAASVSLTVTDAGNVNVATFNAFVTEQRATNNTKVNISTIRALDTPENITIAVADWVASGALFTAQKTVNKASAADYCNLAFIPQNPNPATKAGLQTLQKNLSYLFTRPTIGDKKVTFTAVTKPTIALTFAVVGGAVS